MHTRSIQAIAAQTIPTFVRLPAVLRITGLGRSTIYRMIAKQQFPRPVRVGDRAVAWRQVDLDTWSETRPPASDPAH